MIPLSTLLTRIRVKYEAEAGVPSPVRWSDARLTDFVNEALETLAENTGFYERYCTIPVEEYRRYYDVRGFTPETVVKVKGIWSSDRNDWLWPKSVDDLGMGWEQSTGTPHSFFTRGIHWIVVHPVPTETTGGTLRVHFSGVPSRLNHPQAVLGDLPDQYYPAVEDYVLYELSTTDRETKRAIAHFQDYLKREADLRHFMDRRGVSAQAKSFGRLGGRIR